MMASLGDKFKVGGICIGLLLASTVVYGIKSGGHPTTNPYGGPSPSNPPSSQPSDQPTPSPSPSPNQNDADHAILDGNQEYNGVEFTGACGKNQQDTTQQQRNNGTGTAPDLVISYYRLDPNGNGGTHANPVPGCVGSTMADTTCHLDWIGTHAVLACGDLGAGQSTPVIHTDGYTKTDGKGTGMIAVVSWGLKRDHSQRHYFYEYFSDCQSQANSPSCAPIPPDNLAELQ